MAKDEGKALQYKYYRKYLKLGGTHNREMFNGISNAFFDICLESFIGDGELDRDDAIDLWIDQTQISPQEANIYFEAIDSVTCLS